MIKFNRLLCSGFLLLLSAIIPYFFNVLQNESFIFETSVWCLKGSNQSNICQFKNICYDAKLKTFLFFLGDNTIIKGFNDYTELQSIQLSSIQPHNHFYANVSIVDSEEYKVQKQIKTLSKTLLFSRFKPNNLMHIIHDDLFPIFLTLESACLGDIKCMESYNLMFHDDNPKGPFFSLYKLFSKNLPVLPNELHVKANNLICFREMLTGLILDGIFYQYGYKKPHGPVKPTKLTHSDISRFTSFIKNKFKIQKGNSNSNILLLSRQKSRKILNIVEVKKMIEDANYKLNKKVTVKLINLDLFMHDLTALIKLISECEGLIGMHGAEMILSLFLKPGSFVFELFPFGINPDVVSFIKPISELEGSNFMYFSWRNLLRNNSLAHPDAHPLFGGIAHLDKAIQQSITNTNEVPPVECCNNPLFLYHMYQDTFISNDFSEFYTQSLSRINIQQKFKNNVKNWFYPYKVSNVTCNFNSNLRLLNLNWYAPFNAENKHLKYSLYVRDQTGLFTRDISTEKRNFQIEVPVDVVTDKFEIWISAVWVKTSSKSPDLYLKCS